MTALEYGTAFEKGFAKTIRFLVSRGARPEVAEETAQAAWTRGWTYRRRLRDPRFVCTWVNTIAMNLFRNSHRLTKRRQPLFDMAGPPHSILLAVDVEKLFEFCRQGDRPLLKLHYLYGYTTGEISDRVGLSPTAVRVRLSRARKTLRKTLEIDTGEPRQQPA
jgi:RNA polymerase sigma-70 factor (ECF subfamily)